MTKVEKLRESWSQLDARYHETFRISPNFPSTAQLFETSRTTVLASPSHYSGPGFFYTLTADRTLTRCGVMDNIQDYVRRMQPNANDVYLDVSVAYWKNLMGYNHMREFKQQFKRIFQTQ